MRNAELVFIEVFQAAQMGCVKLLCFDSYILGLEGGVLGWHFTVSRDDDFSVQVLESFPDGGSSTNYRPVEVIKHILC